MRLQAATGMNGDRGFNNLVGCAMKPLEVMLSTSPLAKRVGTTFTGGAVSVASGGGSVEEEISILFLRHSLEPGLSFVQLLLVFAL